jgi:proteasome lid subunit RPN8/RPN11
MFTFTDKVITDIGLELGSREPELGGALIGPPGANWITAFLFDPDASVTRSSYIPSARLVDRVEGVQVSEGVELKGIVHSHPGSYDVPSGPDRYAFRHALDENPRMAAFLAPIVTRDRSAAPDRSNELGLTPTSRMTIYAAYRSQEHNSRQPWARSLDTYAVEEVPLDRPSSRSPRGRDLSHQDGLFLDTPRAHVMPIAAHVGELVVLLDPARSSGEAQWGTVAFNGVHFLSVSIEILSTELVVLVSPTYPITKPIVLVTRLNDPSEPDTNELSFQWTFSGGMTLARAFGPMVKRLLERKPMESSK